MTRRKPKPKPPGIPTTPWSSRQLPAVPLDEDALYSVEATTDPAQFLLHPLPPKMERDPKLKHDLPISMEAYWALKKKQRKGESIRACHERVIFEAPDAVEPDPFPPSPYA